MHPLLRAAHPEPSLVVTTVTAALAVAADVRGVRLGLLILAVGAGQASVGWSNDWLDALRGVDAGRPDKPLADPDARHAGGGVGIASVRRAALAAGAATVVLSLLVGVVPGLLHLVGVGLAWAYNRWLKFTAASIACYLGAFGLLPVVVTTAAGDGLPGWWAVVAAACFGAGVHLANALPDIASDRASGVRGLPQRLGVRWSLRGAVGMLAVGATAALLGPGIDSGPDDARTVALVAGLAAVLALLAGVVVAGRRGRLRTAFRGTMVVGLLVVGVLVAQGGRIAG